MCPPADTGQLLKRAVADDTKKGLYRASTHHTNLRRETFAWIGATLFFLILKLRPRRIGAGRAQEVDGPTANVTNLLLARWGR